MSGNASDYPPVPVIPNRKIVWSYDRIVGKYKKIQVETINNKWWYKVADFDEWSKKCPGEERPLLYDDSKANAVYADHYFVYDGKHTYYLNTDGTVNIKKTYEKYGNQWNW